MMKQEEKKLDKLTYKKSQIKISQKLFQLKYKENDDRNDWET